MAYESDLRVWLRQNAGVPVTWIEPGLGASVGQPDAMLMLKLGEGDRVILRQEIKIELKAGSIRNGTAKIKFRPAQVRYHRLARNSGLVSFVLAALEASDGAVWVYLCPGYRAVEFRKSFLIAAHKVWHLVSRMESGQERKLREALLYQLERYYGELGDSFGSGRARATV